MNDPIATPMPVTPEGLRTLLWARQQMTDSMLELRLEMMRLSRGLDRINSVLS